MANAFPPEVLVAIFHNLPIKDRCRLACTSKSWSTAAQVDSVSLKLKESYVPDYLHVALPDSFTQQQAAACPIMSLARSADITRASAATGSLLHSMPSLEVRPLVSVIDDGWREPRGSLFGGCIRIGNCMASEYSSNDI